MKNDVSFFIFSLSVTLDQSKEKAQPSEQHPICQIVYHTVQQMGCSSNARFLYFRCLSQLVSPNNFPHCIDKHPAETVEKLRFSDNLYCLNIQCICPDAIHFRSLFHSLFSSAQPQGQHLTMSYRILLLTAAAFLCYNTARKKSSYNLA